DPYGIPGSGKFGKMEQPGADDLIRRLIGRVRMYVRDGQVRAGALHRLRSDLGLDDTAFASLLAALADEGVDVVDRLADALSDESPELPPADTTLRDLDEAAAMSAARQVISRDRRSRRPQ